jgi:hypothetical protein
MTEPANSGRNPNGRFAKRRAFAAKTAAAQHESEHMATGLCALFSLVQGVRSLTYCVVRPFN